MTKALSFIFLLLFSSFLNANDSQYLIKEIETLRDTLPLDDPSQMDLTLRLADLYFDISIQEGTKDDLEILKKNRLKALDLYKNFLEKSSPSQKSTGVNRIKIQFQMARLLSRLDQGKMAQSYYLDILENKDSPQKMLEQSALALAEWFEEEAQFPSANKYYQLATSLCDNHNACNYIYYRLAWLYYKDTKLDDAIITMEKSLWLDENLIRENSLVDLIFFLSNRETDGYKELDLIKKISSRSKRPDLLRSLVEAFYVAGNRLAGCNLLAELNKEGPNLYYEVRLLEEFYGFRKWDQVEKHLALIEKKVPSDIPTKTEEAKEVLATLRRFIVQLDAEVQSATNLKTLLKRSLDVYLTLYPNDELRPKMQSAWLSAEEDKNRKLTRLKQWIKEDIAFLLPQDEIRKLRQTRLALAQEQKIADIVIEESLAIVDILKNKKEADEFLYVASRELYEQGKYDIALPYFKKIVLNAVANNTIDTYSILSQNLILDIYNNQKNYDGIIAQVSLWKEFITHVPTSNKIKEETESMEKILLQAQFEKSVAMKESPEALNSFYQFCLNNQYVEKSCPNAKVLSIKFKDQEKLVKLLEKMGDQNALMNEYELMGRFSDAAQIREKIELNTQPSLESFLKIAFLYELGEDIKQRDRVLNQMVAAIKKEKTIPAPLEKAVYASLLNAGLLNEKMLLLPWSLQQKLNLASYFELEHPSATTKKILLTQKEFSGPAWSKVVLEELQNEYRKIEKIKFHGSSSKFLFQKKTMAIEKFANRTKEILNGSDLVTRIYILHMLKITYKNIANEILNTPIPEGLSEGEVQKITDQIAAMADPFDRAQEDYDKLLKQQMSSIEDNNLRQSLVANTEKEIKDYAALIPITIEKKIKTKEVSLLESTTVLEMRKKLLNDPEDKTALLGLQEFYSKNDNSRLASYYAGRIDGLKRTE